MEFILEIIYLKNKGWGICNKSWWVNTFQEKFKNLLVTINIQTNIFRIEAYNPVMCGYFCIVFIDFILKNKSLTDFTNLYSPNDFKKLIL